ncbi:MAG: Nif3-like dinuclear metal center hexameric protein [Prevotella sp.]|nr:Nif3-like dinuclear metal center hexameric protein [Prevotella sp.]
MGKTKIQEGVNALERFAPLPLQEGFDNAGLQVGLTETQEVSGALLCLDVTEAVVDEAVALKCNLIVSHHPLIFRPLKCISDRNDVQRTVRKAIKNDITVVSMHTNMDNAPGGVNYRIAEKMGLEDLAFFGPQKTVEAPVADNAKGAKGSATSMTGASGVVGVLKEPLTSQDFMVMLKRTFDVECVMANQLLRRPISRVAVCGGAGAFLLGDAIGAGADAFVTGEMHYHDYFGHDQEIQIAVIGHYQSEQYTNEVFRDIIQEQFPDVKCYLSQANINPIVYI